MGNFDEDDSQERNSLPYSVNPVFRTPTHHSAVIVDEIDDFKEPEKKFNKDFSHDYLKEVILK